MSPLALGDTGTVETLRPEELTAEEKQQAEEAKDNPGVKPAEMPEGGMPMNGGPGAAGQGAGGGGPQGGGMPDAGTMEKFRQAQQDLMAKMTEEEKAKYTEQRQSDVVAAMQFLQQMSVKYEVELPSPGRATTRSYVTRHRLGRSRRPPTRSERRRRTRRTPAHPDR